MQERQRRKEVTPGRRFGSLVVVSDSGRRYRKAILWECVCDCGNITYVRTSDLNQGSQKSCGCKKYLNGKGITHIVTRVPQRLLDNIGSKRNRLTIIGFIKEPSKRSRVRLQCECGNIIIKPYDEFRKGRVKSCGCLSREISEGARIRREQALLAKSIPRPVEFKLTKDLTGKRYGKLTVLYFCGVKIKGKVKKSLWYCKCDCGREVIKCMDTFRNANPSCGCINKSAMARRAEVLNNKRKQQFIKLSEEVIELKAELKHKTRRLSKTVRFKVFTKFGDRCVICGTKHTKNDPLCIHHLKPHWRFPKLRYLTVNNIPFCRDCHDRFHKYFGYLEIPTVFMQMAYIWQQRKVIKETLFNRAVA